MIIPACPALLLSCCFLLLTLALGPPAAPRDRTSTELVCFGVCQIEFAHAFARIGEGDADRCTLPLRNLTARHVRYADCLFRHRIAPIWGSSEATTRATILARRTAAKEE